MKNVKINGKWDIIIPDHRAARPDWYSENGWERKRLDSMVEHIKKGDTICYVGAEEGEMAALCQLWGAGVFLIEPNPKVWANIRAIWESNTMKKPKGYFVGFAGSVTNRKPENLDFEVGDKDGWPLCAYGEIIGDHGFRELYQQADSTPQIKIDDLGIQFTGLSIDVEGSEWQVLRGAEQTMKNYKPKIWLSGHPEFMFHQFGEYLNDLRTWIKAFGYKETLLSYEHEVHLFYEAI